MKCPATSVRRFNRFVLVAAASVLAAATFTPPAFAQDTGSKEVIREAQQSERDAAYTEAELAASRRALDQAIARAENTVKVIATLRQESATHADRVGKLNAGEEGKRLASTLDSLTAGDVAKMIDAPAVDAEQLAANQKQAENALRQLKAQRDQDVTGFVPPQAIIEELHGLTTWAGEQRSKVRQQAEWLDQQLSAVAKDFNAANAPTLHDVIVKFQHEDATDREASRLRGAEQAQEDGQAAIAQAARKAELERLVQDANLRLEETRAALVLEKGERASRLKRLMDTEEQRLADLNTELTKNQVRRDKQKAIDDANRLKGREEARLVAKRQEASTARVREVLAPFISAGYFQPSGKMAIDQGPVSLSALQGSGALERSDKGLAKLIRVATDTKDKQRPRWGLKTSYLRHLTAAQLEMVKEAQHYLSDLGEVLVEQGQLAK